MVDYPFGNQNDNEITLGIRAEAAKLLGIGIDTLKTKKGPRE
jgi:hypothetical protein